MSKAAIKITVAVVLAMVVDGLDLQVLALALPSITKELKLSPVLAGLLGTSTLVGMGIGGACAGWLSDRIGRARVTWWSILLFSICTGVIGFSQEYWHIAVARAISGLGLGAVFITGNLLVSEYVPTRIRNTALGFVISGWSIGYILAALSSSYVTPVWGWRATFLVASVPGLICLLMLRGVSDSPSWYASREAARKEKEKGTEQTNELALIWNDKNTRRTFILWSLSAFALQYGYYGASTWIPSYLVKDLGVNLKSMGWYLAATYSVAVVSKPIYGWLGDRFGRRIMWIITGLAVSIAIPTIIYLATPSNIAYLLLVFGGLYSALYAIFATYMSESFPTAIRGTAMAVSYNLGRVGAMLSPVVIGWAATNHSIGIGIMTCGIAYLFCTILPGIFIKQNMYDPKAIVSNDGIIEISEATS